MLKYLPYFCFLILLTVACKNASEDENVERKTSANQSLLQQRYQAMLQYTADSSAIPRSYSIEKNEVKKVRSNDWTSGFFPGNLWQLYLLTGNDAYKEKAKIWTAFIEREKYNGKTHDMGFKIFCSFGNGLKVSENQHYKDVILKSAQTLATRFNTNIGCLRSWDWNADIWGFPVIIDNMMNLELFFETTKMTGDSSFYKIAVQHANTTLQNHFRPDGSSFHVVVYDTISGQVIQKVTHQGISDDSAWARGQAWAIYGYTMAYRYTKDEVYLQQAIKTTEFFINHPKLREDGIPYWDFDHEDTPNISRDVSAGVIVASALVELYGYTNNIEYLNYSKKITNTLSSDQYILEASNKAPFILTHSTGNGPKNDEMDGPIVYADYYYLETLLRLKAI